MVRRQREAHGAKPISAARRRGPPYVIKNACLECKRSRSKCDGLQPCERCASRGLTDCRYEVSVRVRKEELKSEIEMLQKYRRLSEHVLNSLSTGNQSDLILHYLRRGEELEAISDRLDAEPSTTSSEGTDARSSSLDEVGSSMAIDSMPGSAHHRFNEMQWDPGAAPVDATDSFTFSRQWTAVTSDSILVENLMALYFCWEYPAFPGLVKKYFLRDFQSGEGTCCSSLLVNAILALACRYSELLALNDSSEFTQTIFPPNLDKKFFQEAEQLLTLEEYPPRLTTIQAMCLMSLREATCGQEEQSWVYAEQANNLASNMGLNERINPGSVLTEAEEVQVATFWGASTLKQAYSLLRGHTSTASYGDTQSREPIQIGEEDEDDWIPYTDGERNLTGDGQQIGHSRSVFRRFCELADIAYFAGSNLLGGDKGIRAQELVDVYMQHLDWYDVLPASLRLGNNSTPLVLFVHMYYHFAMMQLFRPFLNLRILSSNIIPRDICIQSADTVTSLTNSYRRLYGLSRVPSFLPYMVVTSVVIRILTTDTSDSVASAPIVQGVLDLEEMGLNHQFARDISSSLRTILNFWDTGIVSADQANMSFSGGAGVESVPANHSLSSSEDSLSIPSNDNRSHRLLSALLAQNPPKMAGGDVPENSGFEWNLSDK